MLAGLLQPGVRIAPFNGMLSPMHGSELHLKHLTKRQPPQFSEGSRDCKTSIKTYMICRLAIPSILYEGMSRKEGTAQQGQTAQENSCVFSYDIRHKPEWCCFSFQAFQLPPTMACYVKTPADFGEGKSAISRSMLFWQATCGGSDRAQTPLNNKLPLCYFNVLLSVALLWISCCQSRKQFSGAPSGDELGTFPAA